MARSANTKPEPKGIPAIVWVWMGWFGFWLAASAAALNGYVNDFAGVLRPEAAQRLEGMLASFERETSTQVAVAV